MNACLLLLGLLASVVVGGCMLATAKEEYRDDFAIMKPAVDHTELVLDNINGTVSIAGVDGLQQVEIAGVKIAKASTIESAKEEVARISINVDDSGPALRVKTEQPNGSLGVSYTVNYQIRVPHGWKVTVKNINGDVKVRDIRNAVVATIVNGQLEWRVSRATSMARSETDRSPATSLLQPTAPSSWRLSTDRRWKPLRPVRRPTNNLIGRKLIWTIGRPKSIDC
jgi:hypothetical protein